MIQGFESKGARFLCDLKHLFFSQHIKYEVKSGKTSMRNINIVASAVKTVHWCHVQFSVDFEKRSLTPTFPAHMLILLTMLNSTEFQIWKPWNSSQKYEGITRHRCSSRFIILVIEKSMPWLCSPRNIQPPHPIDMVILEIGMRKIVKLASIRPFACLLWEHKMFLFFLLTTALDRIILICIVNNESGPSPDESRPPWSIIDFQYRLIPSTSLLGWRYLIGSVCQVPQVLAMEIQK